MWVLRSGRQRPEKTEESAGIPPELKAPRSVCILSGTFTSTPVKWAVVRIKECGRTQNFSLMP